MKSQPDNILTRTVARNQKLGLAAGGFGLFGMVLYIAGLFPAERYAPIQFAGAFSMAIGVVCFVLAFTLTNKKLRCSRCLQRFFVGETSSGDTRILHWEHGVHGRGALFVGDSPQVTTDRRGVSFMYSYPNYVPLRPSDVREMRERIEPLDYDDVYGFSWGRNIIGGGRAAVMASFERYLEIVGNDSGDAPGRRDKTRGMDEHPRKMSKLMRK